jgi:hypothetical protein
MIALQARAQQAALRKANDERLAAQESAEQWRADSRRQLAKALHSYLGFTEQEVADLFPVWPAGEHWVEVDGLRLFWSLTDPYMDDWYASPRGYGQLYACRPAPVWACLRVNCAVPGYTGKHLDWVAMHSGTPDFDLVTLGKWLETKPRPAADGDTHCPLCNAEARRNRERAAPVLTPGQQLVEALDRYLDWRGRS